MLMRALAPAREDRFQSAEEMRQALADVMAEDRPARRRRAGRGFVRGLYEAAIEEERAEREQLLAEAKLLPPAPATSSPAATPLPAVTPPPESARDTTPARPAISLEALGRAAVPVAPRPVASAVPGLAFPREEETLGVDFVGRVIENRYRVLRKLGEGGMGTVYAAEHVEIGKGVAIKILHPRYSTEQELVERFRREARAASRIGHPNIIDVMDFGTTEDGCAYFIMEHLDGIDLADVLSHERRLDPNARRARSRSRSAARWPPRTPPASSTAISSPRTSSSSRATARRTSSRCWTSASRAARAGRRRLTNPGIAMGTPEYMAPEQAAGGVVDHRGDIYSVGALLYEMVTGQPPQKRDGEIVGPRSLRLQLSEDLDRIIVRALAQDPAQRYQSMAQMEYDLVKTLFGRTRAVADLLGLHQAEARVESSPHDIDDPPSQPTLPQEASLGDGVLERLDARRIGTPAWNPARPPDPPAPVLGATETTSETTPLPTPQPLIVRSPPPHAGQFRVPVSAPRAQFRSPPEGLPPLLSLPSDDDGRLVPDAPPVRSGRAGRRFLSTFATFAVLALAGVAAVRIYGKLPRPWNMRTSIAAPASVPAQTSPPEPASAALETPPGAAQPPTGAPPPPTPAQQAAARLKVALADIEKMLAAGPTFDQLPELEGRLAAARKDGGTDAAAKLAARAQEALIKAAAAEMEKDEIETGVGHYKAALALDAPEKGHEALAEALRGHAMTALTERKDPGAGRALGARRRGRRQQRWHEPRAAGRHALRRARVQGCGRRVPAGDGGPAGRRHAEARARPRAQEDRRR